MQQHGAAIFAISAAVWAVAHVWMHGSSGWPHFVAQGEWDVLLTASAMAGDGLPHVVTGTIRGQEFGSYLVALLVALPIAAGVAPVVAGKLVGLTLGSLTAATTVSIAAGLVSGVASQRAVVAAAFIGTAILAFSYPDWQAVSGGVDGSTRNSVLPQVLATGLALSLCNRPAPGRAVLAGAWAVIGWLINPLGLWTLGWVFVLASIGAGGQRRACVVGVVAGAALTAIALALVLPGGGIGLKVFLSSHLGSWIGPILGSGVAGPGVGAVEWGPTSVARHVGQVLAGRGGALEPGVGEQLGWLLVWCAVLTSGALAANRRSEPGWKAISWLGLTALFWWLPLSIIPENYRVYPAAYRFWRVATLVWMCGLMVGVGLAVDRLLVKRLEGMREVAALLLLGLISVAALAPLRSLGQAVTLPAGDSVDELVKTGGHRLLARNGRPVLDPILVLVPHAPSGGVAPLLQGFGAVVGQDIVRNPTSDWRRHWMLFRTELRPAWRLQIAVGVGCGLALEGASADVVGEVATSGSPSMAGGVAQGVAGCTVASGEQRPRIHDVLPILEAPGMGDETSSPATHSLENAPSRSTPLPPRPAPPPPSELLD